MKKKFGKTLFENLKQAVNQYLTLSFWLLMTAILIRLFETILLNVSTGESMIVYCQYNLKGLFFDIVYFVRCTLFLFPIYFIFFSFSQKFANYFFRILIILVLIVSFSAIIYYSIAGILLDSVVLAYSIKEIIFTISSSQSAPWWAYLTFIVTLLFFLLFSYKKITFLRYWRWVSLIIVIISLFVGRISAKKFENNQAYYTIQNKVVYFFQSINEGIRYTKYTPNQLNEKTELFQSYFPEHQFVDNRYPFLYYEDSQDNLSSFFNKTMTSPHLVFIIVEGLGREFSGEYSKYPSATPFIDSLAMTGLSWLNCFSTAYRTFAALPAIFGDLPFGKNGFMSYKNNLPDFHSLIKILIDNQYETSFFYGGWLCFDDMCYFLKNNNIHNFLDENRLQNIKERTQWGVYDHKMFEEAIEKIDFNTTSPRLDIYLTLSTHDPFEYPNSIELTEKYKNQLKKSGKLSQIPPEIVKHYASFLYLDQSLKKLIYEYKKRPGFENTIFIITGDHNFNMGLEPLDIYHVPLIIWSPLLKEHRQFPALSSHRDITPSFLAYLKNNYNISTPEKVTWLNHGLDTSSTFQSTTFIPMMDLSRNLTNLVYKDYFLQKNKLYKLVYNHHQLSLQETKNDDIIMLYTNYKILDLHTVENDALIENRISSGESYATELLNIDNDETMNEYLQSQVQEPIVTYKGEENSIFFKNYVYPLNIIQLSLKNKQSSIIAQYHFKLYIPSLVGVTNNSSIQLITILSRSDGEQYYWGSEELNSEWYGQYDKWATFDFKNIFKKKNYHYQEGDILKIYLHNPSQRPFYFSELRIEVQELN